MTTTRRGSAEVEVRFVDRFTREVRQAARTTEDEVKRSQQRNKRVVEQAAKDQPYQDADGRWRDGKGRYLKGGGPGGGGAKGGKKGNWDPRHGAREMMDLGRSVAEATYAPIETYAAFEKQMDSVAAATFDMTKAMDVEQIKKMNAATGELSKTARRLGADTRYSASEAAGGMDILAKTFDGGGDDFQKAKDVTAAMPAILNLAAASNKTIEQSADVATTAMSQFNLKAEDMGRISDVIVKTANTSATGLLDLGEAFSKSGKLAKDAGIDIETYSAMLGVLGNKGLTGSVAGTGLGSIFGNIQSGMKKQKSALSAVGIDISDKKGNLRPFVDLLSEMNAAADKKFGKGKGGVRRDRWLQGLMGGGIDKTVLATLMDSAGSGELQKMVESNKGAAGTAKTVADAMSDNAAGAADELSGAYEELQLTIGEELIPAFRDLLVDAKEIVSGFANFAKENPELVKSLGMVALAIAAIGVASGVVSTMMMANPVVAILTAVAVAGGLIYQYWEPISAMFQEVGAWLKENMVIIGLLMPPLGLLIGAASLIIESWEPIKEFFAGLWGAVTEGFAGAMDWILDKINWVGEKIEAFKVSIMSEEEYAAYTKQKGAAAEAAARSASNETYGGLFSDDLDKAASTTARGGLGDNWGAAGQNGIEKELVQSAFGDLTDSIDKAANTGAYAPIGPSMSTDAEDVAKYRLASIEAEIARGEAAQLPANRKGAKSEMVITVKGDPTVVKTELKGGDPEFPARMNAGGQ